MRAAATAGGRGGAGGSAEDAEMDNMIWDRVFDRNLPGEEEGNFMR